MTCVGLPIVSDPANARQGPPPIFYIEGNELCPEDLTANLIDAYRIEAEEWLRSGKYAIVEGSWSKVSPMWRGPKKEEFWGYRSTFRVQKVWAGRKLRAYNVYFPGRDPAETPDLDWSGPALLFTTPNSTDATFSPYRQGDLEWAIDMGILARVFSRRPIADFTK